LTVSRRWRSPAGGLGDRRHSLQIEIDRGLYMDEGRFEKAPGFEGVRRDIAALTRRLVEFVANSAVVA
jgi:N-formylglutamate deformylase